MWHTWDAAAFLSCWDFQDTVIPVSERKSLRPGCCSTTGKVEFEESWSAFLEVTGQNVKVVKLSEHLELFLLSGVSQGSSASPGSQPTG